MKNTILIILLTAIFSAFCFTSCKNTEKDEPNGNSMVCDPRTYLYDEEAFDLSGFLVVKFKNPEHIHYLPIRNFIGWKDNAYYIPFFDWKLPFFNSFDNNPSIITFTTNIMQLIGQFYSQRAYSVIMSLTLVL